MTARSRKGREESVELGLTPDLDLAAEVADHPAKAGVEELEGTTGALELVGMAVAAGHDRGTLGHPHIALAERDPEV